MNVLSRVGRFLRRHKHAEEVAAEAIGFNLLWRLIVPMLAAATASAAITAVASQQTHTTIYPNSYALSTKGAAFLTRNEGIRLTPYNDPFNCTVGVGHLIHYGACSSYDYSHWRISFAQAMTMLMHDSGWASRCVNARLTRRISQYQADALTDLAFNAGCGSLDYSGIARTINAGGAAYVPGILSRTAVTASGHYLPGLATRRLAEGALFAHGFYGAGIGYYIAKPQPIVRKLAPRRIPAWTWRWASWQLGHRPYRGHAHDPRLRHTTHAPRRIPRWAWTWFRHTFRVA